MVKKLNFENNFKSFCIDKIISVCYSTFEVIYD